MKSRILRKIISYWPNKDPKEITDLLDRYGSEDYHREKDRVYLAILKLSDGKLDLLEHYLDIALSDYRDVLAWAEYPEEMKLGYAAKSQLQPEDVKALQQRDREQYLNWLDNDGDK
jgi:hypothetical protein